MVTLTQNPQDKSSPQRVCHNTTEKLKGDLKITSQDSLKKKKGRGKYLKTQYKYNKSEVKYLFLPLLSPYIFIFFDLAILFL